MYFKLLILSSYAFQVVLGDPQSFCSSGDRRYSLSPWDLPVEGSGNSGGMSTWSLTFDDTPSGYKQKITGFGASVTDSTVTVFNKLPAYTLSELLRVLLTADGANFSLMRHTIASSDLSGDPAYSYDDNNGQTDTNFNSFNLGDRGYAMADMLKRMKDTNPSLQIVGTPWSPPGWMKLNRKLWGTTQNNNLDPQYETQYAQYFVKYLQAYRDRGVEMDAITIQNEPLNSRNGMPTMWIEPSDSGRLISSQVAPAIRAAGFRTSIWAYDHNTDRPDYPRTVLSMAGGDVSAVAWHCYANPIDWTVLTSFHNSYPNIPQYMTECWTSPQTSWAQAADFTVGPLQNWASGSQAWVLGTDTNYGPHLSYADGPCTTCRGLVVVDSDKQTYQLTVDYYMMAQYSKFMPRGATVLDGTGSWTYGDGTGLEAVASLNPDGTRTVVMRCKFNNDLYVTVDLKSGRRWSGRVGAMSVVTWVLPA